MIYKRQTSLARTLRRNQTDVEKLLWFRLRSKQIDNVKFRRQQPIASYIVDFIAPKRKLVIELDGGQHNDEATKIADQQRTEWLQNEGYTVLRFWNSDLTGNLENVLEKIRLALRPSP